MKVTTPFDEIENNLKDVYVLEKDFKTETRDLLDDPLFLDAINKEICENFEKYLSNQYTYFTRPDYDNDSLQILYSSINNYYYVLSQALFQKKKDLLQFQMQLLDRL